MTFTRAEMLRNTAEDILTNAAAELDAVKTPNANLQHIAAAVDLLGSLCEELVDEIERLNGGEPPVDGDDHVERFGHVWHAVLMEKFHRATDGK